VCAVVAGKYIISIYLSIYLYPYIHMHESEAEVECKCVAVLLDSLPLRDSGVE
jgi:hypothetical protein